MTSSKNDWKGMKSLLKAKFSKLSDFDINGLNGHMDQLSIKIQKVYAYDKVKAEQECKVFYESIKKSNLKT